MSKNTFREIRKYLYGVAIASIPVLVAVGWLDPEAYVYLVPLLVAIFNVTPEDAAIEEDEEV